MSRPLVLAITGASGAVYSVRLLECLLRAGREIHLTISDSGRAVMRQELGVDIDSPRFDLARFCNALQLAHSTAETASDFQRALQKMARNLGEVFQSAAGKLVYHDHRDFMTPIASGSFLTAGMVICPCSGSTTSAIAHGGSGNLIQRAADVHLKERRKLVIVPREAPLSTIQLDNLRRVSEAGAIVLPAMPGWYHEVRSIGDLVDFVVARILDQFGIEHDLMKRWGSGPR